MSYHYPAEKTRGVKTKRFDSFNPFYMKYSRSESGHFDGQRGYGYVSIEKFVDAARSVNAGKTKPSDYDGHGLPTILNTVLTTAILNAGRLSLDEKRPVNIKLDNGKWVLEWCDQQCRRTSTDISIYLPQTCPPP